MFTGASTVQPMVFLFVASGIDYLTIYPLPAEDGSNFEKRAFYNKLPVYKVSQDLLPETFQFIHEFSKEYTVGESLKKETVKCLS